MDTGSWVGLAAAVVVAGTAVIRSALRWRLYQKAQRGAERAPRPDRERVRR